MVGRLYIPKRTLLHLVNGVLFSGAGARDSLYGVDSALASLSWNWHRRGGEISTSTVREHGTYITHASFVIAQQQR